MNYTEKVVTQDSLKHDVLCYWQMNGNVDKLAGVNSRYLPKGQNLLVFNFGDEIGNLNDSNISYSNQLFSVVPAIATSRIINQKGEIDLFGISFIGDGLFKLIQLPTSELIRYFPDVLRDKYEGLHEELKNRNFHEKIKLVEKFLTGNLNQGLNSPPFQKALKIINETNGIATVSDIANMANVSERQLQRLFKTRIGISPKDYCKIIRVNNYLDLILTKKKPIDWMELVVEYDYHDQPHLITEVKSIAKLSPKKLHSYRDTLYHRYIKSK